MLDILIIIILMYNSGIFFFQKYNFSHFTFFLLSNNDKISQVPWLGQVECPLWRCLFKRNLFFCKTLVTLEKIYLFLSRTLVWQEISTCAQVVLSIVFIRWILDDEVCVCSDYHSDCCRLWLDILSFTMTISSCACHK